MLVDSHMHVYRTKAEGRRAKQLYDIWEYGSGGQPQFASWDGDEADAVAALEQASATHAIVTSLLDPPLSDDPGSELIGFNEWTVDLCRRKKPMFACLAVDTRYLPMPDLLAHLRTLAAADDVVGIKIHPPMQQLRLGDERMWPLFEMCQELDLRIVAHSGPSREGDHLGEPDAYRPLLDAFPSLRLALAHLGGASWKQAPRLASDYHVYFDLSEVIHWVGARHAPTSDEMVGLIRDIGPERIMTGSDFPWYDVSRTVELVRGLPDLRPDEAEALVGGTAGSFFGLAPVVSRS